MNRIAFCKSLRKTGFKIGMVLLLMALANAAKAQSIINATDLKCEYLVTPLGIDSPHPRLSWKLADKRTGAKQTAYRIIVGIDSTEVLHGEGHIWNTGWVASDRTLVSFNGTTLQPFTRYFWSVEVAGHDQKKSNASITSFETGMMGQQGWQGAWISDEHTIDTRPAPYFRKEFSATKRIRSARAYIAAAGLYELSINGIKVGDHRLDPMYTRFDRRTLYVAYDVTNNLTQGNNALGVLLGNGWYNHQSTAVWNFHEATWRARPTFCMDLRITYEDGSMETVTSGKDWKTKLSPVIFNSIYTAEHYDARLELPGWNRVAYNDSDWQQVIYRSAPSSTIVSQTMHPIRNVERIEAKDMHKLNDTTYVYNLGRNIAGVSAITLQGDCGTVVRLKHGERLYQNGHVDMSNIDEHYRPRDTLDPFQTDIYILSGKGQEVFMPHFSYKGFQYVEVTSNKPITLGKESLVGYFMHSDVPSAGKINASDEVLSKIVWATNNSYLSNLFGYPTDCPQREKNGWTGDAQIAIETGLFNFDGITVYEKWMADHRDEQQPNGVLPSIIPTSGWGYEWGNGPDWTSTMVIIPWNLYLFYGDDRMLRDNYDNMKRYVDHITAISPTGLTTWGLGDWVPVKSKSPVELTSSCYYYADALILSRVATILGNDADRAKYTSLAEKIRQAFQSRYFHADTGLYGSGLQTELSVALFWGLVPDSLKSKTAAQLARRVEADNYHLDVGLLGQKAILNALSENGYADVAYRVASQQTYPSWGWWIKNGATTLYENWNIDAKRDISLNHIMFGEIGAWLYKGLGGIKPDPARPGFKNVLVAPYFAPDLRYFEATHTGPHGDIRSSWTRKGKNVLYMLVVPPNSTATVKLPILKGKHAYRGGKKIMDNVQQLGAGEYKFEWR